MPSAHTQGPTTACPQHPNHFHHHGYHPHNIPTIEMAMQSNPIAPNQGTAVLSQQQQPTVIFAAAPPVHQVPHPVLTGFPPAPSMQAHSGVAPPVLAMHPGHQPFPPPLGQAQAIHIHNHPGQSQPLPPPLLGQNIQGFPPSIAPQQSIGSNVQQGRSSLHSQQEFNDPAIMSVSKLPPPRPNLQQHGHGNLLSTNIVDINSRPKDMSHQRGPNPIIPISSNVKSVQDLEREMMGGSYPRKANIATQQTNKFHQHNRNQGHLPHNLPLNGNNTRQMQPGFRNGQGIQVKL